MVDMVVQRVGMGWDGSVRGERAKCDVRCKIYCSGYKNPCTDGRDFVVL